MKELPLGGEEEEEEEEEDGKKQGEEDEESEDQKIGSTEIDMEDDQSDDRGYKEESNARQQTEDACSPTPKGWCIAKIQLPTNTIYYYSG